MSDTIYRQSAIDTLDKHLRMTDVPVSYPGIISALTEWLNDLPSARPEPHYDEWCDDCKEYDKERHCCPRWNKVIRETLKDAQPELRWIPCSPETMPEEDEQVFVYLFDDSPYIAWFCGGRWHTEEFVLDEDEEPAAWLPLPKPYKKNTE